MLAWTRRKGSPAPRWWECESVPPWWKAVRGGPETRRELPSGPAILLLGTYAEETKTVLGKGLCLPGGFLQHYLQ